MSDEMSELKERMDELEMVVLALLAATQETPSLEEQHRERIGLLRRLEVPSGKSLRP